MERNLFESWLDCSNRLHRFSSAVHCCQTASDSAIPPRTVAGGVTVWHQVAQAGIVGMMQRTVRGGGGRQCNATNREPWFDTPYDLRYHPGDNFVPVPQ